MRSTETAGIDLDLLAYDIADLLDRNDCPLDIAESHIRPALPAFLAAITKNAAADDA